MVTYIHSFICIGLASSTFGEGYFHDVKIERNISRASNTTPRDFAKASRIDVQVYSVCVCVFSSHSFWTSSSLDVPDGVTQGEGHTGFFIHFLPAVRALIFLARRIQPFLFLIDREVEFCVLTI